MEDGSKLKDFPSCEMVADHKQLLERWLAGL
jgi:hypothetical protein